MIYFEIIVVLKPSFCILHIKTSVHSTIENNRIWKEENYLGIGVQ